MNQEKAQQESAASVPTENSQAAPAGFKYEGMELTLEQMLKAGVHFGHKKSRWNPKMKPYIFSVRNNIHIIDLEKSLELFQKALDFVENIVKTGGKIIFIGTKPQAKQLVKEAAEYLDMPFVDNRWLGGTLTNFSQIKKRIKYLNDQEGKLSRGELEKYTKYEQIQFKKEIDRMNEKMGGLKKMESLPQAIFVTDVKENDSAVREARELKVPVVAIVDTNINPDLVDHIIPGNDDALSSLRFILGIVAKSIKSAKLQPKIESTNQKMPQGVK